MRLAYLCATVWLLIAAGCSSTPPRVVLPDGQIVSPGDDGGITPTDGAPVDVPPHNPGDPGAGAHAAADWGIGGDMGKTSPLVTPAITTQPSGSVIVVGIGRGNKNNFSLGAPTDNKGNTPYQQLDIMHPYRDFDVSGTAVYAFAGAKCGSGFQLTAKNGPGNDASNVDEMTLFAVEILDASKIQAVQWAENPADNNPPSQVTSPSVTTTGPATLIAFWWGEYATPSDAPLIGPVTPDSTFSLIDSQLYAANNVQGAMAVRNVAQAGTFSVTWTAKPAQDAQMWLIAVQ
jgi:hypothetical protein